jgi:hypothetical protein
VSYLVTRLVLSFIVILLTPVLYVVLHMVVDDVLAVAYRTARLIAVIGCGVYLAVAWIQLWHGVILWSRKRFWLTLGAIFWSIAAGHFVALFLRVLTHDRHASFIIGSMSAAFVWLATTTRIWRESASERIARLELRRKGVLKCPRCGYNMKGLCEARCPECGTRYTLDELMGMLAERSADLDETTKT